MIDKKLLDQLSTEDKNIFLGTLDTLINQTFIVENEYKNMKAEYEAFQKILTEIIEFLPTAIWVLDESGGIMLENTSAKNIGFNYHLYRHNGEVEIDDSTYLIKASKLDKKTIVQATDITEQKRTQRLISMGQMAAHLAHEIRNPVGSVAILASTLAPIVGEKIRPIVEEIRKSIWRVERIIKATLLFTKGVSIKRVPFNLKSFEDELSYCISSYSYQKEIEFGINLPNIEIEGDFDLLSMVLQNLIFNAIDAIEDCKEEIGVIDVYYETDATNHYIGIKDSGIPVPDKAILFDPFKTTKTKGNGLGLALSMQIARAHGGEIVLNDSDKTFILSISK